MGNGTKTDLFCIKLINFLKKTIDFRFFFVYLNRNKCGDSH